MFPDELREYFQQSIEWDGITGPYTSDQIDEETVRRFLALAKAAGRLTTIEPNEPIDSVLRRLDLIRGGQIRNGALILFGRDPQKYFPNSNIRIGRFRRADIIIGDHEIRGNLFSQFDEAERIIKSYIGVRYDISEKAMQESFQRKEVWDSPLPAIREALLKRPHPPRLLQQHKSRPRSGSSTTLFASTTPAASPKASPSRQS